MKHKLVTGTFVVASILQFGLGIYMTYLAARRPGTHVVHLRSALILMGFSFTAHAVLEVDFPDGHICLYGENKTEEIAYTGFSLLFGERVLCVAPLHSIDTMVDLGAFIVIVIRLLWRRPSSIQMPSIVQTIIQDATLYVLLLCTFRIIFLFMSILTAVCSVQVLHEQTEC